MITVIYWINNLLSLHYLPMQRYKLSDCPTFFLSVWRTVSCVFICVFVLPDRASKLIRGQLSDLMRGPGEWPAVVKSAAQAGEKCPLSVKRVSKKACLP